MTEKKLLKEKNESLKKKMSVKKDKKVSLSPKKDKKDFKERKSLSPKQKSAVQSLKSIVKKLKPISPRKKSRSFRKQKSSPKKKARSPRQKSRSPRQKSKSPRKPSPKKQKRSPRKQSRSPKKQKKSPRKKQISAVYNHSLFPINSTNENKSQDVIFLNDENHIVKKSNILQTKTADSEVIFSEKDMNIVLVNDNEVQVVYNETKNGIIDYTVKIDDSLNEIDIKVDVNNNILITPNGSVSIQSITENKNGLQVKVSSIDDDFLKKKQSSGKIKTTIMTSIIAILIGLLGKTGEKCNIEQISENEALQLKPEPWHFIIPEMNPLGVQGPLTLANMQVLQKITSMNQNSVKESSDKAFQFATVVEKEKHKKFLENINQDLITVYDKLDIREKTISRLQKITDSLTNIIDQKSSEIKKLLQDLSNSDKKFIETDVENNKILAKIEKEKDDLKSQVQNLSLVKKELETVINDKQLDLEKVKTNNLLLLQDSTKSGEIIDNLQKDLRAARKAIENNKKDPETEFLHIDNYLEKKKKYFQDIAYEKGYAYGITQADKKAQIIVEEIKNTLEASKNYLLKENLELKKQQQVKIENEKANLMALATSQEKLVAAQKSLQSFFGWIKPTFVARRLPNKEFVVSYDAENLMKVAPGLKNALPVLVKQAQTSFNKEKYAPTKIVLEVEYVFAVFRGVAKNVKGNFLMNLVGTTNTDSKNAPFQDFHYVIDEINNNEPAIVTTSKITTTIISTHTDPVTLEKTFTIQEAPITTMTTSSYPLTSAGTSFSKTVVLPEPTTSIETLNDEKTLKNQISEAPETLVFTGKDADDNEAVKIKTVDVSSCSGNGILSKIFDSEFCVDVFIDKLENLRKCKFGLITCKPENLSLLEKDYISGKANFPINDKIIKDAVKNVNFHKLYKYFNDENWRYENLSKDFSKNLFLRIMEKEKILNSSLDEKSLPVQKWNYRENRIEDEKNTNAFESKLNMIPALISGYLSNTIPFASFFSNSAKPKQESIPVPNINDKTHNQKDEIQNSFTVQVNDENKNANGKPSDIAEKLVPKQPEYNYVSASSDSNVNSLDGGAKKKLLKGILKK